MWDAPESADDPRNVVRLADGSVIRVVAFDVGDSAVTATALSREQATPAMIALDTLRTLTVSDAFTDPRHKDHQATVAEVRRLRGLLG